LRDFGRVYVFCQKSASPEGIALLWVNTPSNLRLTRLPR
jgi:hypothetical protein